MELWDYVLKYAGVVGLCMALFQIFYNILRSAKEARVSPISVATKIVVSKRSVFHSRKHREIPWLPVTDGYYADGLFVGEGGGKPYFWIREGERELIYLWREPSSINPEEEPYRMTFQIGNGPRYTFQLTPLEGATLEAALREHHRFHHAISLGI